MRKEISAYSANIGKDPLLVQGAGGNISWKDGKTLWVKASGIQLSEANDKDIFVPVDLTDLRSAIQAKNFSIKPKVLSATALRPSIETLLHALMPHKIVLHLHAIDILSYLVRIDGLEQIEKKIKLKFEAVYVRYHKPGKDLAFAVYEAISERSVDIVFLQNHGVVIGGAAISQVSKTLIELSSLLFCSPMIFKPDKTIDKPNLIGYGYIAVTDPVIQQLALNTELFSRLSVYWALYPDHVVFLGPKPTCFEEIESFYSLLDQQKQKKSSIIFIKEVGVFSLTTSTISERMQLRCYADVMIRQDFLWKLNPLKPQDISDLLDWEAEKYRKEMNR